MKRATPWKESGPVTPYVGMEVQKRFRNGWYKGVVTVVEYNEKGGVVKLKIDFEDGDDEVIAVDTFRESREKGDMLVKHHHDKEFLRRVVRKYLQKKETNAKKNTEMRFQSVHGVGILTQCNGIFSVTCANSSSSSDGSMSD